MGSLIRTFIFSNKSNGRVETLQADVKAGVEKNTALQGKLRDESKNVVALRGIFCTRYN